MRAITLLAALTAVAAVAGPAAAGPNLMVGVSDDYLKSEPNHAAPAIRQLGFSAVRLTLDWRPGQRSLHSGDAVSLQKAVSAGTGARIIVAVYSDEAWDAPHTDEMRDDFCSTVQDVIERFPQVNDVVIWNEPNKSTFWKPQFNPDGTSASPGEYVRLLASCYQKLHAFRAGVNVIHAGLSSTGNDRPDAASNVSHSPGNFIRQEGVALRAGLAARRPAAAGGQFFDTFALHPYGESSAEPPWKPHDASSTIALGDWDKLMQALWDAFNGTPQPLPGRGTSIWYLEMGFQTTVPSGQMGGYRGAENTETVPDVGYSPLSVAGSGATDQATQLADAIRLAYCQPYVDAIFNFLLKDEPDLGGWQSGLLWADWAQKGSFYALQRVIGEVKGRSVNCSALKGGPVEPFAPKVGVEVEQVAWPKAKSFNWKNDLWRFRIQTGEHAAYTATLYRSAAGRSGKAGKGAGSAVLTASGTLKKLYFSWVRFPERRLAPGRYYFEIVLRSQESITRTSRLASPSFVVQPRR